LAQPQASGAALCTLDVGLWYCSAISIARLADCGVGL
jgi:hypothetical protein